MLFEAVDCQSHGRFERGKLEVGSIPEYVGIDTVIAVPQVIAEASHLFPRNIRGE